ncbi:MAG: phage tail assembly chaperone [Proteobacteria bacterium]|nr:phage tail assembly chaperone [Pseudomonadota bacterium]
MKIAFGVLKLAPGDFWSMTTVEFPAALDGHREVLGLKGDSVPPPLREELEEMMRRFPD